MQYAPVMLAAEPANGLTCGIDWARDDHAIAIVDAHGREVHRSTVEHSAAGLRELVAVLARTGASEVAIERPDGPVVDALLGAGITVVVISPNQLKNLRGRYGSAGNKDDRFDAFVLADTLRTDRARLRPLVPDTAATVALRATCRARKDLIAHRVSVANQLREHLKRVFPGAGPRGARRGCWSRRHHHRTGLDDQGATAMNSHEHISRSERDALLTTLASMRSKLVKQRIELVHQLRTITTELESIDKQLNDIEQSEFYLQSITAATELKGDD